MFPVFLDLHKFKHLWTTTPDVTLRGFVCLPTMFMVMTTPPARKERRKRRSTKMTKKQQQQRQRNKQKTKKRKEEKEEKDEEEENGPGMTDESDDNNDGGEHELFEPVSSSSSFSVQQQPLFSSVVSSNSSENSLPFSVEKLCHMFFDALFSKEDYLLHIDEANKRHVPLFKIIRTSKTKCCFVYIRFTDDLPSPTFFNNLAAPTTLAQVQWNLNLFNILMAQAASVHASLTPFAPLIQNGEKKSKNKYTVFMRETLFASCSLPKSKAIMYAPVPPRSQKSSSCNFKTVYNPGVKTKIKWLKPNDIPSCQYIPAPPPRARKGGGGGAAANMSYCVVNSSTVEAASLLKKNGRNPVSMNFANAVRPGGGWATTSGSQEEHIFRNTDLAHSLWPHRNKKQKKIKTKKKGKHHSSSSSSSQPDPFESESDFESLYHHHHHHPSPSPSQLRGGGEEKEEDAAAGEEKENGKMYYDAYYPMPLVSVIYTPTVFQIRENDGEVLPPSSIHDIGAFVTVAAPDLRFEKHLGQETNDLVEAKLNLMLDVAHLHNHDSIVLGAFGNGAFLHDAHEMATRFKRVLERHPFTKNPDMFVVFAILAKSEEDHNLSTYREVFDSYPPPIHAEEEEDEGDDEGEEW